MVNPMYSKRREMNFSRLAWYLLSFLEFGADSHPTPVSTMDQIKRTIGLVDVTHNTPHFLWLGIPPTHDTKTFVCLASVQVTFQEAVLLK